MAVLPLLFLSCLSCMAVSAFSQEANISAELSVMPRICVLNEQVERCEEFVQITWKTDQQRSLCLYRAADGFILKCWQDVNTGEVDLPISVNESIAFELRDSEDELIVIARTEFKVMRDKKKYRRGRRNPWSFF